MNIVAPVQVVTRARVRKLKEENEDKSEEDCTNIELADDPYYKCYINSENENVS